MIENILLAFVPILIETYGLVPTLISVTVNVILAGIIFSFSSAIIKILGEAGARALSKIMSLLLGAIAVMMIRKGVLEIIAKRFFLRINRFMVKHQ